MNRILDYINSELTKTAKRPFLIAIDGNCSSGKSTLADYLTTRLNCSVFHMDDFFLQPQQRTTERLSTPGGNIDYERFQEEVLNHIDDAIGVTYQIYNCHQGTLADTVTIPYHEIVIVEGVYSQHPYFKDIYDLKIFLEISEEEQKNRILSRNGEAMWAMFRDKWIPMETNYFNTFCVKERSHYIGHITF